MHPMYAHVCPCVFVYIHLDMLSICGVCRPLHIQESVCVYVIDITSQTNSIANFNGFGKIVGKLVNLGIGTNPYGPMTYGNTLWFGSLSR